MSIKEQALADWRLFCPESWDDAALTNPVAAAAAARRREQAGIPDAVRHAEKWRLALEMIDEMAGPGGWGVLEQVTAAGGARPVVVADAGYGEGADFRLELAARGWRYVIAVKGSVSARPGDAVPQALAYGGVGRPSVPRYRTAPLTLRQLAIAHAGQVAGMTLYQVLHELQIVLALILGACPLCTQPVTLDRLAGTLTPT